MKSLDQHLEEINNMRKQLELLEAELNELREQCNQKPELEYPLYMQSKDNKAVIKFTGLTTGVVVTACKFNSKGYFTDDWVEHTDTDHWQPIIFDEARGIADKQLCECWGGVDSHMRYLKFYDALNHSSFNFKGQRYGDVYNNYRPIPYADYPDWAIEAEKTLQD